MAFLKALDRFIVRLELILAIGAMSGTVAILVAQVFFRYVLQSPLFFAEELALVLMIIATFSGFSLMVVEGRLVSIDLLGGRVSHEVHQWIAWLMRLTVFSLGLALAVFAIGYLSVPWVWIERSATLNVPRVTLYVIVTFELCFLVFHQIVQLVESCPCLNTQERTAKVGDV